MTSAVGECPCGHHLLISFARGMCFGQQSQIQQSSGKNILKMYIKK